MTFRRIHVCAVAILMVSATACDLSPNDPNIPTEDEVLNSSNMIRVGIGLRAEYSNQLAEPVYATGMADMLAEILEQRRVELYLQHVRWSDLRRFGLTPKFMWVPIPITECDRNAATPSALCQAQPPNIPHAS